MLWLLFILVIIFVAPLLILNLFQRDQCALAFQRGEGQCCYGIGSCKHCFFVNPVPIHDERCHGQETCYTNPMIEQRNALVDTILCECNYYNSNVTNTKLEEDIRRLYKIMTGNEKDAKDICTTELMRMVKFEY